MKRVTLARNSDDERAAEQAQPFPEGRARWVLAAALLAVFVGSLDLTVIATLLPKMVSDLQINTADINRYVWIVSGYLLAYMVTIPVLGRVSDILGRRPVFAGALAIFLVGSILSARAGSLAALVTGRAIQGFGGGALVPVTMALVGDILPPRRRAAVIGLVGAIDTMGWVLGPLYGAALLGLTGSWRTVFWINVPIAVITVVVLLFTWRGVRQQRTRERLDLAGALLLSASLVCLNLALSSGSEAGSGTGQLGGSASPLAAYRWSLLGGALVAMIAFILWERRAKSPLVPLALFRLPVFSAATIANLLIGASLIVVMVDVPLFASLVVDDPKRASLVGAALLTPFTLMMAVGSIIGGILTGRFSARPVAVVGVVLAATGLALMRFWSDSIRAVPMSVTLLLAGLGFGVVIAPVASVAINVVRRTHYGVASGLVVVTRLIGMTVGLSLLGGWGVGRLSTLLQRNAPTRMTAESDLDFQTRTFAYIGAQTVHFSLVVLRETFVAAAIVCAVAVIPALIFAKQRAEHRGMAHDQAATVPGD
ncbi:MAG: MFS transporter [Thermomicrobiales bacterium]